MPNEGDKNVKEPQRRQNRAGKFLLDVDVTLDNVGIRTEPVSAQGVDVFAVKSLIEPDLIECGLGMENCDGMQRSARRECVRCQAEENSDSENNREQEIVDLATK